MKSRRLVRVLKILPFVALFIVVFGFVVMGLWNWLMPAIFGLRRIGYWEAWGLIILSKILFGGFHGMRREGGDWRHRMKERWERMTPEERDKFRQAVGGSWGSTEAPDSKS